MKSRTKLIDHIIHNSYVQSAGVHVLAGKRQTGKTTAGVMKAIFNGLEEQTSKYRILIIVPTFAQELNIQNMIYHLCEVDEYKIHYKKVGHNIWLNVNEDIVFEIDLISSNRLDAIRGRFKYDFGVIEEINYCNEWKECLGTMLMMTKDFMITSEAVL